MAIFCSSCGAENQDGAQFCSKCGKPTASSTTTSAPAVPPVPQNVTVVVKNINTTPIFSLFGICCGILGIFTLGFIFVPLGLLFTLIGLLRGEFLVGTISGVVNVIGFFTSPVLMALIGLGAVVGTSGLTKSSSQANKEQVIRAEPAAAQSTGQDLKAIGVTPSMSSIAGAYSCHSSNSYAFFDDSTYTNTVDMGGQRVSLSFGRYSVDGKALLITHLGTTNASEVTASDVGDPRIWEYEIVEVGQSGFKARVLTLTYRNEKERMSGNIALNCERNANLLGPMRNDRDNIDAAYLRITSR